jgi:serine/threonine protein kinase
MCWKITDFGFSSPASGSGVQTETGRGTRCYRAPELFFDNPTYSHKLDIWGVGCIFFEVITRVKAFTSDHSIEAYSQNHGRLRMPYLDYHVADTLQFCEETLQKTLARNPQKRPTPEKLIIYLEDFLGHLEYDTPRATHDMAARPLHSREGGIRLVPNDAIATQGSNAERIIARPIFMKSDSADEWSDGEWTDPSSLTEHSSYHKYQCEECQRQGRTVNASKKSSADVQ